MDVVMSEAEPASRSTDTPSLQQLKNLGSLPDLDSKLEAAARLCNHGYRAEMVLKWLLPELQNDATTRSESRAWDLFAQCLRPVSYTHLTLPTKRIV